MKLETQFWKDRKVFVTGHTGFKGSWLCLWLQSLGANVRGYALSPPSQPNLFEVTAVGQGMDSILGDVRHYEKFAVALGEFSPDIVFHLAAQPLVRASYENPVETYETNVMGTVHLLNALRKVKNLRAVVNVTTDKVYENREWEWGYREIERLGGYDPYSSSKSCSELVTNAFRQSFFHTQSFSGSCCALASARAGNIVGGGDWATDRLIPDMLRGFELKASIEIRNPDSIRPWQYVLAPLSGYLILAQKLFESGRDYEGAWNFGPGSEDTHTVRWIADYLVKEWGEGAAWHTTKSIHPHETKCLKLDCSKANSRLNWHSTWSLEHSLKRILAWHKAYLANENMQDYSLREIHEYQESLIKQ